MRRSGSILLGIIISAAMGTQALAEKRVALVIGNSVYEKVPPLVNPANDAGAVARMFQDAGFDVVESRRDLNIAEMRRALRGFSDNARQADVAVVYFAGHGIEVDGTNYLVPVDAVLERDVDAFDEAVSLDRVLTFIEPARQLRLVILDACRDNPFNKSMKRTIAGRAVTRGLAKVEPASPNTLIAYAAKAGSTALDGDQNNSPFTSALVKHLPTPGLDLRRAFGFVRDDVLKATSNKQEPFFYGSLGGSDVALVPASNPPQLAAVDPASGIRRDYELAERVGTKTAWDSFIKNYPSGFYTDLARAQRDKLASEEARIAATDKAKAAHDDQIRLAIEGARADERAKAAERARVAEQERVAAEATKRANEAKVAEAERLKAVALAKVAEETRLAVNAPIAKPGFPPTQARPAVGVFGAGDGAAPLTPERERALNPKQTFKECENCPEMVVIPGGSFVMGSPANEAGRSKDEGPQHGVTIARAFAVGRFAVTFGEWDACVADNDCRGHRPSDLGWGRGRRPVIHVSWHDAKTYVAWLSRKTGKTYRLLTEAEREYIMRAGTTTAFWFGSQITADRANYNGTLVYGNSTKGEYRRRSVPVDSFEPNPFGVFQVHGNVWDWTEDCWNDSYQGALTNGSALTTGDCNQRVLRGGSWVNSPGYLRSASRLKYESDRRDRDLGFRVARSLPNKP